MTLFTDHRTAKTPQQLMNIDIVIMAVTAIIALNTDISIAAVMGLLTASHLLSPITLAILHRSWRTRMAGVELLQALMCGSVLIGCLFIPVFSAFAEAHRTPVILATLALTTTTSILVDATGKLSPTEDDHTEKETPR